MGLTLMFVGILIAAWGAARLIAKIQPVSTSASSDWPGPM